MSWQEIEIENLFDIKHGYAFKSKYFQESGKYVLTSPGHFHLLGGFRKREGKEKYSTENFDNRYLLRKNDIIIAMTEQGEGLLGSTAIVPENDKYLHNQRLGLVQNINSEKIYWKYIPLLLNEYKIRKAISNSSTGTKVKHTSPKRILELKCKLPSFKVQKQIANIIYAYNDLIENNLKRIKLLEKAAQNIYKGWFVSLRFPGYENTPINLETGLPEGWVKVLAKEYFDFKRGIEVGSKNYVTEESESTIPFLRVGSLGYRDTAIFTDISLVKDRILVFSDLCISMDGSIGLVGYGLVGAYSTGLRKVEPKIDKYGNGFIYCLLKSKHIQDTIRTYAKGSTILHASSSIEHLKFNDAPDEISKQFNSIVEPIYSQMLNLNKQNQKLKAARDILLPRLMNRTIEV